MSITKIELWWSEDHYHVGWSFRLHYSNMVPVRGAVEEDYADDCDLYPHCSDDELKDAVVEIAHQEGIEIDTDSVIAGQQDGGWAEWNN